MLHFISKNKIYCTHRFVSSKMLIVGGSEAEYTRTSE